MKLMKAILLCLLLAGSLSAQTVEELQVEKRSAFPYPAVERNPFLPIGWVKPEPKSEQQSTGKPVAVAPSISTAFFRPEAFAVTSISTGSTRVAVINGRIYNEGELLPMNVQGQSVAVLVAAIRDGKVTLRFSGKEIQVPLRAGAPPAKPGAPPAKR